MTILTSFLVFLFGASIGSFISVVNHRIQKNKKGIVFGHSKCPHCEKQLKGKDMIPLVSYLLLKGQCRFCHKKISPIYFLLELALGTVFLALYFNFPFLNFQNPEQLLNFTLLLHFLINAIYSTFFIAIFFYDLQTHQIPDLFLFPLLSVAALDLLLFRNTELTSAALAFIAALIFFGGQIYLSKGKWLGSGDLYLAMSMAFIFGIQKFMLAVFISYLLGSIISIPLLLNKKLALKSHIAFGPFLVMGSFVTLFFGNQIIDWYTAAVFF